jgi:hypothetical protein
MMEQQTERERGEVDETANDQDHAGEQADEVMG